MKQIKHYSVSKDGTVTNTNTGRVLKLETTKTGYKRVTLSYNGSTHRWLLHRLVSTLYLPNPDGLPCVNHLDGDKSNNSVDNLEWCSYSDNERHSIDVLGKQSPKGESHYKYKVTPEMLEELMYKRHTVGISCRKLAKEYGISHQHISYLTKQ